MYVEEIIKISTYIKRGELRELSVNKISLFHFNW